ncbi:MAG: hypothetical protein JWR69_737 [Pedosphaera sp.]|nr:hypothetical protein [Pedosphaera sp.]
MVILAVILCPIALLVIYVRSPLRPWLELKILERQVKKNVEPMELQRWATNLLAQYSGTTTHFLDYYGGNFSEGTNFPSGLKKVGEYDHGMHILTGDPSVAIFGMSKGEPFLVVGAPSLATPTNGTRTIIPWRPGIYFVGE